MLTPKGESVLARLCPAGVRVAFSLFAISNMLTGCASPPAAPAPSQPSGDSDTQPPDEASEAIFREIEEADIIKFEDGYFYLANRWTGLRIIDARTIERQAIQVSTRMWGHRGMHAQDQQFDRRIDVKHGCRGAF